LVVTAAEKSVFPIVIDMHSQVYKAYFLFFKLYAATQYLQQDLPSLATDFSHDLMRRLQLLQRVA
jgi:hypothetical protein